MHGKQVYRLHPFTILSFPPPFGGSSSKEENLHRGVFRAGAATPDNCQTTACDPNFHELPKLEFQGNCGSQGARRPRPDKAVMEKAGEFFSALISEGCIQNRIYG